MQCASAKSGSASSSACETVGRIGALGEVAGDEMVEGSGSLGAGGRDGEAAGIEMHGVVPGGHFPIPTLSSILGTILHLRGSGKLQHDHVAAGELEHFPEIILIAALPWRTGTGRSARRRPRSAGNQ